MKDSELSAAMLDAEIDYLALSDQELWKIYCQMTLKMWGPIDPDGDDEEYVTYVNPENDPEWADKREPVGLALINRGYSARELLRGYPDSAL